MRSQLLLIQDVEAASEAMLSPGSLCFVTGSITNTGFAASISFNSHTHESHRGTLAIALREATLTFVTPVTNAAWHEDVSELIRTTSRTIQVRDSIKAFAFTFNETYQRPRQRRFIQFKTPRVDSSWSNHEKANELYRFLAATRLSQSTGKYSGRKIGRISEKSPIQPVVSTIRRRSDHKFANSIFSSIDRLGFNNGNHLRLYMPRQTPDLEEISKHLIEIFPDRLEICTFAETSFNGDADAYAVLAHPDSDIWNMLRIPLDKLPSGSASPS